MSMAKTYYPLYIDIFEKKCVVVGGGLVAERKIKTLLKFKAKVFAVALNFTSGIIKLKNRGRIKLFKRNYRTTDVKNASLVIGATNDGKLNLKISRDSKKKGILVNIVDDPKLCSFIVPSIIKRGPLVVSISTSGQAPALAKALRIKFEKILDPGLGRLTTTLGKIRRKKIEASSFRNKS